MICEMPRKADPAIDEKDFQGFHHFKLLLPVLETLHGVRCRA